MADATDEVVTAMARTRFRRVTWADVKAGDVVYYLTPHVRAHDPRAFGPMTVGDPAARSLVNSVGIPTPGLDDIKLLVKLPDEPITPR